MKLLVIARYTLKELLKSKLLWNVAGLGVIISLMCWVAAEFTFGVPGRVALDIGLSALSISGYGIAIFVGSTLISKELESRTIYMIISRPVAREYFLLGKLLGLSSFLALNFFLLSLFSIGTAYLFGIKLDEVIFCSLLSSYLESLLLMMVVVCISIESSTVLTILFSLTLLLTGHAVGETLQALFVKENPLLNNFLSAYHWIFPGFYKFNLKDVVIYQQDLPIDWYLSTIGYGISYIIFLTLISVWLIRKKDLN
jgi:ABC-type transport system involved in multi-copper enzyme maturation permease subunit